MVESGSDSRNGDSASPPSPVLERTVTMSSGWMTVSPCGVISRLSRSMAMTSVSSSRIPSPAASSSVRPAIGAPDRTVTATTLAAPVRYFLYARRHTTRQGLLGRHILARDDDLPSAGVGAAATVAPDGSGPVEDATTTMVALSNPRTERSLVSLSAALANHNRGRVLATHVIQVPDQTSLAAAADQRDRISETSEQLLADARADAERLGVPVETRTILSHEGLAEVFDAARDHGVDRLVMGHSGAKLAGGRVEGALDELTHDLPCDVLVLDERGFDPSEVLLPTAGGHSSELSAEVARALQETTDARVTVLHVADDAATGQEFIEEWIAEHELDDVELLVETGDVETAIGAAAADRSLVLVGATERGLLSRLVGGSLTLSVLDDLDASVLLAERPRPRSLRERLLGRP